MTDALTDLSRQLGERYVIERELGRGGMGAVYLARDRRLDRPVALKVLPEEYASQPELRERFLRETRMAAGFSHPNIVPVFAIEETEHVLAFAMGFVEGESVAARVARDGPLGRRDAVRLLQDVSYALAYAHGRGVVHRDIKPDNVMIERATGRALVMDFGIARAIKPVADRPGLTRVGEVVGTPEYMSPEQAAGESVDGRADLYSLGLVAWFAMSGRTAVTGETTQRILVKQLTEAIPPLSSVRSDLPHALCDVVDRCCMKEADDRYANAEAVVEALDATQLAAPDVPVAVRLLAPDLATVGFRALIAFVLIAYGVVQLASMGKGNALALGLIVAATAWVGGLSAIQEIRRLFRVGFSIADLQRFLALTQTERDEVRATRATDPTVVARRRRRVMIAWGILLIQLGALYFVLHGKVKNGNADLNGPVEQVSFFGALIGSALAATILLSSPFRRPLAERWFRVVWLSRFGRWLMTLAGARLNAGNATQRTLPEPTRPQTESRLTSSAAAATAPPTPDLARLADEVRALTSRVDALESRPGC